MTTFTNRLPEIEKRLKDRAEVRAVLTTAAEPIAEMAKQRAPVDTGRLRESIEVKDIPTTKSRRNWTAVQVWMIWYGIFAEHGTVKQAPHPFLVPAAEAGKADVKAALGAWLRSL